jgi:transcriptional regulator of met regulon
MNDDQYWDNNLVPKDSWDVPNKAAKESTLQRKVSPLPRPTQAELLKRTVLESITAQDLRQKMAQWKNESDDASHRTS